MDGHRYGGLSGTFALIEDLDNTGAEFEEQKLIYDVRARFTTGHYKPHVRFSPASRRLELSDLQLDQLPQEYEGLANCKLKYEGLVVLHLQSDQGGCLVPLTPVLTTGEVHCFGADHAFSKIGLSRTVSVVGGADLKNKEDLTVDIARYMGQDWLRIPADDRTLLSPTSPGRELSGTPDLAHVRVEKYTQPHSLVGRFFVPSAHEMGRNHRICVVGYGGQVSPEWCAHYLVTSEDYAEHLEECRVARKDPVAEKSLKLTLEEAEHRLVQMLQAQEFFPDRLCASPGEILTHKFGVVEHTASALPGFSGAPGCDLENPTRLRFLHLRTQPGARQWNYGISVMHPYFIRAYIERILPALKLASTQDYPEGGLECLKHYLESAGVREFIAHSKDSVRLSRMVADFLKAV